MPPGGRAALDFAAAAAQQSRLFGARADAQLLAQQAGQRIGLLILKKEFIDGYQLQGIINGPQQHGLRGGTESNILIAGATAALLDTFTIVKKNEHLKSLRTYFISQMEKICKPIPYLDILSLGENLLSSSIISTFDNEIRNLKVKKIKRKIKNLKRKVVLCLKGIMVFVFLDI